MAFFTNEAATFPLPKFHRVRQIIPDVRLTDIPGAVQKEMAREEIRARLCPGKTAAVLVGSRGIDNLAIVVRAVLDQLKQLGVQPFLVPAMGSHGSGIAENQMEILAGYGITEEAMGVPVRASMDTVILGASETGIPVHADKIACSADYVIPINRIKVHTDFKGPIESGLCKMLVIGLGKHNGCARVHQEGFANFPRVIPEVAKTVLEHLDVPFGMGIIENGYDHTHMVVAIPGDRILEREPEYLAYAKTLMPRLQFDALDVLVIDQIGKDISGNGMDPNITGRNAGRNGPRWEYNAPPITRIVVNRISEASHGSGVGMGCADFATQRLFSQLNYEATYANLIASCVPEGGAVPMAMPTEEDALRAAIVTSRCPNWSQARVVRILDTLHLAEIEVSESLLEYCKNHAGFQVSDDA